MGDALGAIGRSWAGIFEELDYEFVEASFARRFGFHGEVHGSQAPHGWRLGLLRDRTRFPFALYRSYEHLYSNSRHVRYLERGLPKGASLDDSEIADILDDLGTVKKELKYK